jgi:hypothetical protein
MCCEYSGSFHWFLSAETPQGSTLWLCTITIAAYSPGLTPDDNTGLIKWSWWCPFMPAAISKSLQTSNGDPAWSSTVWNGHWLNPMASDLSALSKPWLSPSPQRNTNTASVWKFWIFKIRENSKNSTVSTDTMHVLPGCNGPEPLLPTTGSH